MKSLLLTLYCLLLNISLFSQTTLTFSSYTDVGQGLNRTVRFHNIGQYNGTSIDMVLNVNGYYSSEASDTLWYDQVQFRTVAGDFNIKIPYLDTMSRCVDLEFNYVKSGTDDCYPLYIQQLIYDLDSSQLRNEYIHVGDVQNYTLTNTTLINTIFNDSYVSFYSSDEVNKNNMDGSVLLDYYNNCKYNISFCTDAYNNGGNAGFFLTTVADTLFYMSISEDLVYFNVFSEGCAQYVEWNINNFDNKYILEYSIDGIIFTMLSEIDNIGNLLNSSKSDAYYRIKSTNPNGEYEYSEVVFVKSNCEYNTNAYPNPCKNSVNINGDNISMVEIVDVLGKRIIYANNKSGVYDLSEFSAGVISLIVTYNDQTVIVLKILKYL